MFWPNNFFFNQSIQLRKRSLNLSLFEWIGIDVFQMQILDLETCLLWVNKFVDLLKLLETDENKTRDRHLRLLGIFT